MFALILALLCVLANGFFVAAEFAFAKVRNASLQLLAQKGDAHAKAALALSQRFDMILPATQLGITLASLGLGWLGEPAMAHLLSPILSSLKLETRWHEGLSLSIGFIAITMLHIVVGELVPKSMALQHAVTVTRLTARVLIVFHWLTYPLLWVLKGAAKAVLALLRLKELDHGRDAFLSIDELRLMVEATSEAPRSEGGLVTTQRELISRVLGAVKHPVRAIMVPRVDMITLSLNVPLEQSMTKVRMTGYSRYPIAEEGDPDRISGYVYVKDLLLSPPETLVSLRNIQREIFFTPESTSVGDLLEQFRARRIPIAVVVDEYGGTRGIVTLEDVIEEIIGDIQDELDKEPEWMHVREDGTWVIDGLMPINDLNGAVSDPPLDLPDLEGGDTLSGWVLARLGRLAQRGDRIEIGHYELTVEDIRRRRVRRVALRKSG